MNISFSSLALDNPLTGERRCQGQDEKSGSSASNFNSDSWSSAAGSESATIPQPANRWASRSRISAERRPTQNSPSSAASIQPTVPAYQPRSIPSSSAITSAAAPAGSPPIAGVG